MKKETRNDLKLGAFVFSALIILVISLYLIGKNQNFFGSNFYVKARFSNVGGLVTGNNVRYLGIQAGTVGKIQILNDSTIEVTLLVDRKMKPFIRANSYVSIGNDGLMGNKVINIAPNSTPAPEIAEDGVLLTKESFNTEDIMQTLSVTGSNVTVTSEHLKNAAAKIDENNALWGILADTTVPASLYASMKHISEASAQIHTASATLNTIVGNIEKGKGTAGVLLADEKVANNVRQTINNITEITQATTAITARIDSLVHQAHQDINHGQGILHTILKDTTAVWKLDNSLANIENGTQSFEQSMEALKHNFLIRRYIKKKEKRGKPVNGR